jgi:hypothetical protein
MHPTRRQRLLVSTSHTDADHLIEETVCKELVRSKPLFYLVPTHEFESSNPAADRPLHPGSLSRGVIGVTDEIRAAPSVLAPPRCSPMKPQDILP